MKFVFHADDGDHTLDLTQPMTVRQGMACESKTGWNPDEWLDQLAEGNATAVMFAYWMAVTRSGGTPDWADLDISYDRIDIVTDDDEPDDEADGEPGPTGPEPEPATPPDPA